MDDPRLSLLLSVEEAAQALSISVPQIYLMLKRGELPAVQIGRRRLIPVKELEQWIATNTVYAPMNGRTASEDEDEA